jgi:CubicO group peptidase (beta-lactamase class C family)
MSLFKIIAISAALAGLQACTLTKTVVHNFADLDDHRIFANREVPRAALASALRGLPQEPRFLAELSVPVEAGPELGNTLRLDHYLAHTRTAAFIVLHEDRVVMERYGRGYDEHSLLNSFSIAKALMSTLVGMALYEGRIASLDSTVASICPEFAGKAYGAATVRELLTMTSGVAEVPSLLPGRAEMYYGDDLRRVALRAQAAQASATHSPATQAHPWRYSETDIEVLGFVLERAVGMAVSDYLAAKLWEPLGMEAKALWALDRQGGVEKAFCCLSARARDFARFGKLMRDGGRWNGQQIIPAAWAARSALPGIEAPDHHTHQHLWWVPPGEVGHPGSRSDFYAYGHNGQYLYVNPAARLVIVKFSETNRQDPVPLFRAIADAVMAPQHLAEIERLDAPLLAGR